MVTVLQVLQNPRESPKARFSVDFKTSHINYLLTLASQFSSGVGMGACGHSQGHRYTDLLAPS